MIEAGFSGVSERSLFRDCVICCWMLLLCGNFLIVAVLERNGEHEYPVCTLLISFVSRNFASCSCRTVKVRKLNCSVYLKFSRIV